MMFSRISSYVVVASETLSPTLQTIALALFAELPLPAVIAVTAVVAGVEGLRNYYTFVPASSETAESKIEEITEDTPLVPSAAQPSTALKVLTPTLCGFHLLNMLGQAVVPAIALAGDNRYIKIAAILGLALYKTTSAIIDMGTLAANLDQRYGTHTFDQTASLFTHLLKLPGGVAVLAINILSASSAKAAFDFAAHTLPEGKFIGMAAAFLAYEGVNSTMARFFLNRFAATVETLTGEPANIQPIVSRLLSRTRCSESQFLTLVADTVDGRLFDRSPTLLRLALNTTGMMTAGVGISADGLNEIARLTSDLPSAVTRPEVQMIIGGSTGAVAGLFFNSRETLPQAKQTSSTTNAGSDEKANPFASAP